MAMNESSQPYFQGYGNNEALGLLYDELLLEINDHRSRRRKTLLGTMTEVLHHNNQHSSIHWTSCLAVILQTAFLIAAFACSPAKTRDPWLLATSVILLFILMLDISLEIHDAILRDNEILDQATFLLSKLKDCIKNCSWHAANYLSLNTPASAAVTVQWTYRENEIVNLPVSLLVRGDIILMRPGQVAHVRCREIQENVCDSQEVLELVEGDNYHPEVNTDSPASKPTITDPLKPVPFIALDTPYVHNLRMALDSDNARPTTHYDNEYFQVVTVWIERRFLIPVFIISFLVNMLKWIFLEDDVGHWTQMFLTQQVLVTLPLVSLVLPVLWKVVNILGIAKMLATFDCAKIMEDENTSLDKFSTDSSVISEDDAVVETCWRQVLGYCRQLSRGNAGSLPRTANLLHSLGSMTVFCCLDKKGVLSWPNPTAEKIFFLTSTPPTDDLSNASLYSQENAVNKTKNYNKGMNQDYYAEVLDLTHDLKNPFGLQFDDPTWRKYKMNLKPLGLNVLLNTCNQETTHTHRQFFDHVNCVSKKSDDTVAVIMRRCMCQLSHLIGFTEAAKNVFKMEQETGLYRYPAPTEQRKAFLRKDSSLKNRVPMPHMHSIVMNEINSGIHQLFSQGTADIVLDLCSDFWDGHDINTLSEHDRKKILDFYHRYSMSSYCSAFAYRPLTHNLSGEFRDSYVELPEASGESNGAKLGLSETDQHNDSSSYLQGQGQQYHSADSLHSCVSDVSHDPVSEYYKSQCNMIFIGMVTMQYQAKPDIVRLIDNIETACIRFVHFSDENELRSRVFAEKMGLEAGWNCHISLKHNKNNLDSSRRSQMSSVVSGLSNRASKISVRQSVDVDSNGFRENAVKSVSCVKTQPMARSVSAPSYINISSSQVRFEAPGMDHRESSLPVDNSASSNIVPGKAESAVREPTIGDNPPSCLPGQTKKVSSDSVRVQIADDPERAPLLTLHSDTQHIEDELSDDDVIRGFEDIHSESHHTSNTEETMSAAFDISNRAKLPKGIENIRPHLASVDNVPLLVNLFTDCCSHTTAEMLRIMQENGEVVCCIGSSASLRNTAVFMQADISISLEPIYPQLCMKEAVMQALWDEGELSPMDVNAHLNSIGCSLSCQRDNNISLIKLIAQARSHCSAMRDCFLLLLSYHLALTLIQLLASIVQLPPVMDSHHVLWLLIVVLPLLSVTLLGNSIDPQVMTLPSGKNNNHASSQVVVEYLIYFSLRFVPSILISLMCFGLNLKELCNVATKNPNSCHSFYGNRDMDINSTLIDPGGTWNGWLTEYHPGYVLSQNVFLFQIVLYFVCNSLCFVHRFHHLWHRFPSDNRLWCVLAPTMLTVQALYSVADVYVHNQGRTFLLSDLPIASWVIAFIWPLLDVPLLEVVKFHEIRSSVRYQKRVRLEFGTKLGMNSPF